MLNELITSESTSDNSGSWSSLLREFAEEQESATLHRENTGRNNPLCELNKRLPKLSAVPWQSLGGYFDYSNWVDRERFVELDKAIAAFPYYQRSVFGPESETV